MAVKEVIFMGDTQGDKLIERRKYPRVNCNMPCSVKVFDGWKKSGRSKGHVKNISSDGIFLEIPLKRAQHLKIAHALCLRFTLELLDENMYIEAEGVAVRQDKNRFGVKFTTLNNDAKERISDYSGN
jgi:c-di-GMP-binding flagellar brake protein YcgR